MKLIFAGAPDAGATTGTATPTSTSGALMQMLIMLLIFFAMMYFLVILPQRRREKEFKQMIESLKKGDTIITTGGVVGKIVDIKKDVIKIKSANSTELEIHKAYIAKVIKEKEEAKEEVKEDSKE
ncbi:MAG: preprotein translocase subunit YajC [Fervidobacterium sp.]|uniref:Protein translocase subunit yajC n=1 Tax=Fervidobacterium gondwanense DSM 13020 TaxID=1121883 RepID=A0A1M7SWC2_FERGO|nr:preprotein translocase subunit YajC [Fervidobacterium gondwanense]UXF00543.1 membrane protein [Fervidobacterium riparium]SHN62813.1 protein translocase subunit yajC [Fervidobacterium gondwanense DSM 13020]